MGIPKFQQHLADTHPNCFAPLKVRPTASDSYTHVLVDVNSLLHRAALKSKTFVQLTRKLFSLLDSALNAVPATHAVLLALDGVGPVAKLALQRKRREQKYLKLSSLAQQTQAGQQRRNTASDFDSRMITPGTMFMRQIETALQYYCAARIIKLSKPHPGLAFCIDGAQCPGEGEIKIAKYLRNLKSEAALNRKNRDNGTAVGKVAVVGDDSDLVLLALLSGLPNCVVVNNNSQSIFSIDTYRKDLTSQVPFRDEMQVLVDYCLLVMMTGNDYLPKVAKVSIDFLWRRYVAHSEHCIDAIVDFKLKALNINVLAEVLDFTAKPHGSKSKKYEYPDDEEDDFDDVVIEMNCDMPHVSASDLTARGIYIPKVIPSPHRSKTIQSAKADATGDKINAYLTSLLWSLVMYTSASCPDLYHTYTYLTAPSIRQIIGFGREVVGSSDYEENVAFIRLHCISVPRSAVPTDADAGNGGLVSQVCAAMVLQADCVDFLDVKYRGLMAVYALLDKEQQQRHKAARSSKIKESNEHIFVAMMAAYHEINAFEARKKLKHTRKSSSDMDIDQQDDDDIAGNTAYYIQLASYSSRQGVKGVDWDMIQPVNPVPSKKDFEINRPLGVRYIKETRDADYDYFKWM